MKPRAYYNEHEPFAAQWLRNLMAAGHIMDGEVDERSIEDVRPDELRGFTRCHFFAGVGVWDYALTMAGWPEDREVWSGSAPCQPFSDAGKGAGFADKRHLWPAFHHLIAQRRPPVVFGEQVASSDAMPWLDLVQDDLEAMGYAFGAIPFPAASVGAPHIRDRLYWVADASGRGLDRRASPIGRETRPSARPSIGRVPGLLADTERRHAEQHSRQRSGAVDSGSTGETGRSARPGVAGLVGHANGERQDSQRGFSGRTQPEFAGGRAPSLVADDDDAGLGRFAGLRLQRPDLHDTDGRRVVGGFWSDADWIPCRDNKWRAVESGSFPLATGIAGRVGKLRAYGNAICAPAAQAFIEAYL